MLGSAEGKSGYALSKELNLARPTVQRWLDRYEATRDIAAVAAEALLYPEAHAGRRYVLTGGEAVGYQALADALSEVLGTTITYRSLSMDEMRERMKGEGVSSKMIDSMLALAAYQKAGGPTERVSESVQEILAARRARSGILRGIIGGSLWWRRGDGAGGCAESCRGSTQFHPLPIRHRRHQIGHDLHLVLVVDHHSIGSKSGFSGSRVTLMWRQAPSSEADFSLV